MQQYHISFTAANTTYNMLCTLTHYQQYGDECDVTWSADQITTCSGNTLEWGDVIDNLNVCPTLLYNAVSELIVSQRRVQ